MPTNVVKTQKDEELWEKAKAQAQKQGQGENYAYIMEIYKKMNPERFKKAMQGVDVGLVTEALIDLLALLRAQQWSYWTMHWQVQGSPYYGDHLLFQRIYEALSGEIDGLAEKIVAHLGKEHVDPSDQMARAQAWVDGWGVYDDLFLRALRSEEDFQVATSAAYDILKETGHITLGLDDFLMAIANAHETNQYLLQQRTDPTLRVAHRHASKLLSLRRDYGETDAQLTRIPGAEVE